MGTSDTQLGYRARNDTAWYSCLVDYLVRTAALSPDTGRYCSFYCCLRSLGSGRFRWICPLVVLYFFVNLALPPIPAFAVIVRMMHMITQIRTGFDTGTSGALAEAPPTWAAIIY